MNSKFEVNYVDMGQNILYLSNRQNSLSINCLISMFAVCLF